MARRKPNNLHAVLLVDKPAGMTSNRVLQQVKHHLGAGKAGHTGALDPLATGVLPICLGDATKYSQFLLDADKIYETRAQLGQRTDTADADGDVIATADVPVLDPLRIDAVLADQFTGLVEQIPPKYSALKHQGQPLYKLARDGKPVPVKRRQVTLYESRLLDQGEDWLALYLRCSKGTYVRSFVEDLAEQLGTVAHVAQLRRLQHGRFNINECYPLADVLAAPPETVLGWLLPVDTCIAELPQYAINREQYQRMKHGNAVPVDALEPVIGAVRIYRQEHFLGLGEIMPDRTLQARRLVQTDLLE
ncbi:MAG: tRNA pseudouridine(55) synthase TruB [Natronospirillum sp.]